MFSNLNDLRSCVIKHQDKVIIGRKLPSDVLNIIVNQFGMGSYNQAERTQNFFGILSNSDCRLKNVFDYDPDNAPFSGAFGSVFIEDNNANLDINGSIARKFFMGENNSLNTVGRNAAYLDALLNVMNYVLFNTILLEAEDRGIIQRGISNYLVPIVDVFVAINKNGTYKQIGFTSPYIYTDWSVSSDRMKKRTVAHINNFLRALDTLRDYGVYLSHGDLKMGNIVYNSVTDSPNVIDFGISTIRVDYTKGGHNASISSFVHFEATGKELCAVDIAMFAFSYFREFRVYNHTADFASIYLGVFNRYFYENLCREFKESNDIGNSFDSSINQMMYGFIYGSLSLYYQTNKFNYKNFASCVFSKI